MILALLIAGVWMVGCLLVLGICAQAAAGDRALNEHAVAGADSPSRRFARRSIDGALSV